MRLIYLQALILALAGLVIWGASQWRTIRLPSALQARCAQIQHPTPLEREACAPE